MRTFRIQFDEAKNIANQQKHKGISLADAEPVFYDEAALTIQDHDHDEERWVTIGTDAKGRIFGSCLYLPRPTFRAHYQRQACLKK
jgi:uncharacterized DUF497 family protein